MEIKYDSKIAEKHNMIQGEYYDLSIKTHGFKFSRHFKSLTGKVEKVFYASDVSLKLIFEDLERIAIGEKPVQIYYIVYENRPVGTMVILSSDTEEDFTFFDHRVNAFFLGYLVEKIRHLLNNSSLVEIVKNVPEIIEQIELYDNYVFKGEV